MKINIELRFPQELIIKGSFRNKIDIINVCLKYIQFANIAKSNSKEHNGSKYVNTILCTNKMKRLFIECGNSIHSVHFPFNISENKEEYIFSYESKELLWEDIQFLLRVFDGYPYIDDMESIKKKFVEVWDDIYYEEDILLKSKMQNIILKLMMFEPAYLRFDEDNDNVANNHPQYHFDINYTNTASYKIGLEQKIDTYKYIEIIDKNKKCYFIKI